MVGDLKCEFVETRGRVHCKNCGKGVAMPLERAASFERSCRGRIDEPPPQQQQEPAPPKELPSPLERVTYGTSREITRDAPVYECDVIIPYYRQLHWLTQTLDLILSQQAVKATIHLINDCSPEDDREILKQYAGRPNVHWYRNTQNMGPYRSLHHVFTRLATDFIAIQDSDDLPLPDRLWRALDTMHSTGVDVYGAAMVQMLEPHAANNEDQHVGYVSRNPIIRSGYRSPHSAGKGYPINGTAVYRKSFFARVNGFFSQSFTTCDLELPPRAWYAGGSFFYDSAVVAIRRVHGDSLSHGRARGMGTEPHKAVRAEWARRFALYEQEHESLDWRAFGDLHYADPSLTVEVVA